jgi:hypothetical protein
MHAIMMMLTTMHRAVDFLEAGYLGSSTAIQSEKLERYSYEGTYIFNWVIRNHPVGDIPQDEHPENMRNMLSDACVLCKANILDRLMSMNDEMKKNIFSAFLLWVWRESGYRLPGRNLREFVPDGYQYLLTRHDPALNINTFGDIVAYIARFE